MVCLVLSSVGCSRPQHLARPLPAATAQPVVRSASASTPPMSSSEGRACVDAVGLLDRVVTECDTQVREWKLAGFDDAAIDCSSGYLLCLGLRKESAALAYRACHDVFTRHLEWLDATGGSPDERAAVETLDAGTWQHFETTRAEQDALLNQMSAPDYASNCRKTKVPVVSTKFFAP